MILNDIYSLIYTKYLYLTFIFLDNYSSSLLSDIVLPGLPDPLLLRPSLFLSSSSPFPSGFQSMTVLMIFALLLFLLWVSIEKKMFSCPIDINPKSSYIPISSNI